MDARPVTNATRIDEFIIDLKAELQTTRANLNEVNATLDQSQNELNRLTQKKATVTAQLQQFQSDSDQTSRSDIRSAFNSALDAQQRLLVMRGQLDKVQEQKNALANYKKLLERMISFLESFQVEVGTATAGANGISTLEMLINTQEAERQRLSRQMHDGPAQALSNFIVQSEIAARMFEIEPNKAKDELDKLKNSAMSTFQKVRAYISELRPMMLDDLGLVPTIKKYTSNLKEQTGVDISTTIVGSEKRLESYLEVYIFRAIQELVGNAIKHNLDNASKIKIDVLLNIDPSSAKVEIKDNGKGFDPGEVTVNGGLGLKLIRDRAELLGGSMNIHSSENSGTDVVLVIPVHETQQS
jgi:two-component system, NarL family, sensor histidine kinase DegS